MSDIIERHAKTSAEIRQRTGVSDGKAQWTSYACACVSCESARTDFEQSGRLYGGPVFHVAPFETTPELPGWIDVDGKEYEIKEIRVLRNLQGRLIGYRIATAGAT